MEDQQQLAACPFCGGAEVEIRDNGRVWTGMKYSEPSSVSVRHWCPSDPGQPSRLLERVGRDRASAIAAWNRRTSPSSSVLERAREALLGLVELAEDHWPNGATSRKGRAALAEIDRALGGGK